LGFIIVANKMISKISQDLHVIHIPEQRDFQVDLLLDSNDGHSVTAKSIIEYDVRM
jgi:hypothetical protein